MQSLGALLKSAVTYLAPELREKQRAEYEGSKELVVWQQMFPERSAFVRAVWRADVERDARAEDRERYEAKMLARRSCYRGSVVRCLRAVGLPLTEAAALELVHADALQEDAERDVRRAVA
jgi:hypothetical protein